MVVNHKNAYEDYVAIWKVIIQLKKDYQMSCVDIV